MPYSASTSESASSSTSFPSTNYQYRSMKHSGPGGGTNVGANANANANSSASPANMNNQNNSNRRDPTIRHAGRAHIRGKIRRVWRPRYLELCDTGLVRYYELPPTADVTLPSDADGDHVHMIPKDTLIIFYARIIDVTTLRDLHVGLPKGSYGFLFRGQKQSALPEWSSIPPTTEPPREYFCAVATLEEAQTWVIVLQWAASVVRHRRSSSSGNLLHLTNHGSGSGNHHYNVDPNVNDYDEKRDGGREGGGSFLLGESCQTASRSSRIPSVIVENIHPASETLKAAGSFNGSTTDDAFLDAITPSSSGILVEDAAFSRTTTDSVESPTNAVMVNTTTNRPIGRIVVTKVHGYQLLKVPATSTVAAVGNLQWQIAYEIGILILQGTQVEERRVLRTAFDIHRILDELSREVDSKISLNLLDDWKTQFETTRPLPPVALQDYKSVSRIVPLFFNSFVTVDRMLRALAMDANIVNSQTLKHFFVLDNEHPKVKASRWWKTLTPSEVQGNLTYQKFTTVSEDDTDTFVKSWLSKHPTPTSDWKVQTMMWALQRPWVVLGGTGVGLALAVPLSQFYQHVMPSFHVRLDFLMGSWCLAAYLGRELGGKPFNMGAPQNALLETRTIPFKSRNAESQNVSASNALKSSVVISIAGGSGSQQVIEHEEVDSSSVDSKDDLDYLEHHEDEMDENVVFSKLSSPLPEYPQNNGESCWSMPRDNSIFRVRGHNYLEDRIKIPSGPSPFKCRGVDVWLTDNAERHIARHPSVLNGKLKDEDTFLVNFLLPFGNFVSYFTVPPISEFPDKLADVWSKFIKGDQQYRDARLKLLPVVVDGPWIVKAAVGNGTAPALLGKVIPLQYFFQEPKKTGDKAIYEVDVIITASSIAKGILNVVKGNTKSLTIAFAFIIEAAEQEELPETVLCALQVHHLQLEDCPHLPAYNLDKVKS